MGRKIILSEDSAKMLNFKLNPKLYRQLKSGFTSLGKNEALPGDPLEFQYDVLKSRLSEVSIGCGVTEALDEISTLTAKAMALEKPLRPQLQKICENTIMLLFPIPDETINFTCELVDGVGGSIRILPEDDEYEFTDVDEHVLMSSEIMKRRLIDCLIQGGAHELTDFAKDYWVREAMGMSDELPELYERIEELEDYLLFVHEQEITDEDAKQTAHVSVRLGKKGVKTDIESQAILLPMLIRESIRGFMELFSSHGLPEDNTKANHIIKQADFYMAEPWDMRLGTPLWRKFWDVDRYGTRVVPYYFKDVCCLDVEEFNTFMKEAMLGTKKYKEERDALVNDIKHDRDYNRFIDRISQKNVKQSVINDSEEVG